MNGRQTSVAVEKEGGRPEETVDGEERNFSSSFIRTAAKKSSA